MDWIPARSTHTPEDQKLDIRRALRSLLPRRSLTKNSPGHSEAGSGFRHKSACQLVHAPLVAEWVRPPLPGAGRWELARIPIRPTLAPCPCPQTAVQSGKTENGGPSEAARYGTEDPAPGGFRLLCNPRGRLRRSNRLPAGPGLLPLTDCAPQMRPLACPGQHQVPQIVGGQHTRAVRIQEGEAAPAA